MDYCTFYCTPSNTAHFVCLPNQTHLIELMSSLEETPGREMGVSDNKMCSVEEAPRTRVEKHCFKPFQSSSRVC